MPYAKKLRTFALVAAALLLLGTASASGAGKIGGNQIKKNAIASKHIKKNAVQSSDIKSNAVQSAEIKNNTVQSGDIKDGNVTSGDIKNGTVGPGDLANGSVTADKIAPGAVSFQSGLWSTLLRNQTGAAVSGVQAGPAGQPQGDGSLRLVTSGRPTWPPSATRSSSWASSSTRSRSSATRRTTPTTRHGAALAPHRDQSSPRG